MDGNKAYENVVQASKELFAKGSTGGDVLNLWPGLGIEYSTLPVYGENGDLQVRIVNANKQAVAYFGFPSNSFTINYFSLQELFSAQTLREGRQHLDVLMQEKNQKKPVAFLAQIRPNKEAKFRPAICMAQFSPFDVNNLVSFGMELNRIPTGDKILEQVIQNNEITNLYQERFSLLTKREKQVLHYMAQDFSSREISELMHISLHTVNDHRKSLRSKLETDSVLKMVAIARAFRLG